jgi:hypothetical protein
VKLERVAGREPLVLGRPPPGHERAPGRDRGSPLGLARVPEARDVECEHRLARAILREDA